MTRPTHVHHPRPARDLPAQEFHARVKRLLACQKRLHLDALLILSDTNRYYFTGLTTSNGIFLSEQGKAPIFFTDFRYLTMAKRQAPWLRSAALWRPADEASFFEQAGRSWRRVGFEGQMDTARFLRYKAALPHVEWVDIGSTIAQLRAVKSRAEQLAVRRAIAANDLLFASLMEHIQPGQSEWDIRNRVRLEADRLGQGEAFDTIACVGRNGAECHHHPDETKLRSGQPLLVDLGLKLDHYCADMTRCAVFGSPKRLFREVFRIVQEANRLAIRAIRPGMRGCDIDAVARNHISRAGYGAAFGHSLGHGLGLDVHESPSFAASCTTELKPGMVLTVEPGIYLPGVLGVRIEDVILVTRDGCEVLTATPHECTPR